jgi:hypothetical protein
MRPASPDIDTAPVSGRDGGPARPGARSQGRGCARPASEGSLDESPSRLDDMTLGGRVRARPASEGRFNVIPASPDIDTPPVSGRDGGPASSWTRSQGCGRTRPASEGRFNESPPRLDL